MPGTGTIDNALTATHAADGTVCTAANAGCSGAPTIPSGCTFTHLDAAKMLGVEGYRFTQSGAGTTYCYFDRATSTTKYAVRGMFRYGATPTAQCVVVRVYPDTNHATKVVDVAFTTGNRVAISEQSSTGTPLNLTSPSGTPLVPGNAYEFEMLVDADGAAFTFNLWAAGSSTLFFPSMTGTLANPVAMQSHRLGIGTASSIAQLDVNNFWASASGGLPPRPDLAAPVPSAGTAQVVQAGTKVTFSDATVSGSPSSIAWTCTTFPGSAAPAIASASSVAGANATLMDAGVYVFTLTVDGSTSTVTEYVYPASNTDVLARFVDVSSGWNNVGGAASALAALTDASAATYDESPAGPSGQRLLVTMNPFGPGTISVKVAGYSNGGAISRKIDVCKSDGLAVVYSLPAFTLPTTDTVQVVTLDSAALALIPNVADRVGLTVSIKDTAA